jgi:hypothetical protein
MSSEESPDGRRAIWTQRGRKRHKLGGTLKRLWAPPGSVRRGATQGLPKPVKGCRPA